MDACHFFPQQKNTTTKQRIWFLKYVDAYRLRWRLETTCKTSPFESTNKIHQKEKIEQIFSTLSNHGWSTPIVTTSTKPYTTNTVSAICANHIQPTTHAFQRQQPKLRQGPTSPPASSLRLLLFRWSLCCPWPHLDASPGAFKTEGFRFLGFFDQQIIESSVNSSNWRCLKHCICKNFPNAISIHLMCI